MANPSLDALFNPRILAVVGSVKQGKIAHQICTQLIGGGYPGTLCAVNPKAESPQGFPQVPGYAEIRNIPGDVDLAVICTPAVVVAQVVEACGLEGVPIAVVITSGFSEAGNPEGEQKLLQVARQHGLRLIGPNCAGIMNTAADVYASIEVRALPGRTAFITQSGAVGGAVLALAAGRGVGFSKFLSYGNRGDIGETELLEYLGRDGETDAIAVYVESLQDGRGFLQAARTVARSKPLLIIKAGRSSAGSRAAGSHTGSLAGSDAVFDALIRQIGALRVDGMEELLDLCDGFTQLPLPRGRRIAIVTNSGGPGILTADRAESLGLDVAPSDTALQRALGDFLPDHCALGNPIDLTVEGSAENYRRSLDIVLQNYDAAVAINVATPFLDSDSLAEAVADAASAGGKPVVAAFMAGEIVDSAVGILKRRGVPVFATGERAVTVLSRMYSHYADRTGAGWEDAAPEEPMAEIDLKAPLLEPEAVAFLEKEGFPFPEHAFVENWEECIDSARQIGFPLVMKVVSPQIVHKSDRGGVILNIENEKQLAVAYQEMRKFELLDLRGLMLYRQLTPLAEMIAGIKQDPDFGPVVLVGAGGILTELWADTALGIAPLTRDQVRRMLESLRINRILQGFRGSAIPDSEALADLIVSLSGLACRCPQIRELDFNPVFVFEHGCLIADSRILI